MSDTSYVSQVENASAKVKPPAKGKLALTAAFFAIPAFTAFIITSQDSVRNKVHNHIGIIIKMWVVVFVVANFIIYNLAISQYKALRQSQLVQESCADKTAFEGETVRYNMYYYILNHNGETSKLFLHFLISALIILDILIIVNLVKDPSTTFLSCGFLFLTALLLLTMFFILHPLGFAWNSTDETDKYGKYYKTMLAFVRQIRNNSKSKVQNPPEFEQLQQELVRRIMMFKQSPSVEDAELEFFEMPEERLLEYIKLGPRYDSTLILNALSCDNIFSDCKVSRFLGYLVKSKRDFLPSSIVNENDLERHIIQNIIQTDNLTDSEKEKKAKAKLQTLDMTSVLNYISLNKPINMTEAAKFLETRIPAVGSPSDKRSAGCDRCVNIDMANLKPIHKFYNSGLAQSSDTNIWKDSLKRLQDLSLAVRNLQSLQSYDPSESLQSKLKLIFTYLIVVLIALSSIIFHNIYKTRDTLVMTLSILVIIVCLIIMGRIMI
jgi:hypothetical protein